MDQRSSMNYHHERPHPNCKKRFSENDTSKKEVFTPKKV
jgi:hypothetical protein